MKYRLLDLLQPISETSHLRVIPKLVKKVSFTYTIDKVKCSRYCAFRNCVVEPETISPSDCNECLKNKLIFDAGCGSGLLSMSMADDFGMEVVALDLGMGIEKAYEHNTNPYVYFVQGSILEPPIQDNVADFVYCAGVLIHLPDTKIGFQVLPRILKEGGRYFIWVYHPIDKQHHPKDLLKMKCYKWIRDNITSSLPIKVQYLTYLTWTVLFIIKQKIFNLFRVTKDDRTWREKMQDFVDMFSPIYQHRHTEQEVLAWYKELGFLNVDISYQEEYGFGARGDKRILANEMTPDPEYS
jgi:ubiquinone/menaquinone biosynthesis C-methylase UbiE